MVKWAEIKKRYLAGERPRALALHYDVTPEQITAKAYKDNWKKKQRAILDKVEAQVESELSEIHSIYGGLIKDVGNDLIRARREGLMGLTIQDGEGLPNRMMEHIIKAGLAVYLENFKQSLKTPETDQQEQLGFVGLPDVDTDAI